MDQRITLITLGVRDLGRARAFYERGIGWKPGNEAEGVAFYQLGGFAMALYGLDDLAKDARVDAPGSGFGGIALAINMHTREDVDRTLSEAVAAGAKLLKPAEDTFWGGYAGYFADLDGYPWEVAWNPGFPLDEQGRLVSL